MVKEHKKLYKAGKNWVVATLFATSLGIFLGGVTSASADTTPTSSATFVDLTSGQASATAQANQTPTATTSQPQANATPSADTTSVAGNQSAVSSTSASARSVATTTLNSAAAKAVQAAGMKVTDLTNDQISELNKVDFSKTTKNPGTTMTFNDLEKIGDALVNRDPQFAIPYFNASQIKNMPATRAVDAQTGQMANLDIWDSWPVQDPETGYVSNYHGYQLVVAMMGEPNKNDNHIYLLYNKYGDNDFSHWKNAGSIFGTHETPDLQEWSGSAIVNNDGTIQLFYTLNDTTNGLINKQQLATANLLLNTSDQGVTIAAVKNNHVIFAGDGQRYQTYEQFIQGADWKYDDYCLRDGHVVQMPNGERYLVFEGNTGSDYYQSSDQLYKWANYGGDAKFNLQSFLKLTGNKIERTLASTANGALGILKLTDSQTNPDVAEVYSPLVSSLMVSDELERPDVVKLGDKYYLFSATRISRGVDTELTNEANRKVGDNVAMIGYVSDGFSSS